MITAKVNGLDELKQALLSLSSKLRRRALRDALKAGGREFAKEAKRLAPVLQVPTARRVRGALRRAISVRVSKIARRAGDVGVFVNVRPARGAKKGTVADVFYWRFVEFGTRKMPARPFLQPAAQSKMNDALRAFEAKLGPAIQKLNVRNAPAP